MSDRGLALAAVWEGFGTMVLTAALLVVAFMALQPTQYRPVAAGMTSLATSSKEAAQSFDRLNSALR
jgi:hypothetical protein